MMRGTASVPAPALVTAALAERQGGFPRAGLDWLTRAGLTAPAAIEAMLEGGEGSLGLFDLLVAVGRGDLAAGRLYEGHVDALGLVRRLGTDAQRARAEAVAEAGGLLGVWGADDPEAPGRIERRDGTARLVGRKTYASGGAGLALAIVAVKDEGATQLVLLEQDRLAGRFDEDWWDPIGMAETRSDALDLDGLTVPEGGRLGSVGTYEGHPAFGAGAVRFVAVQVGGVLGVWDVMRRHLEGTGRIDDPHQASRLAAALADCEAIHAAVGAAFDRLRPLIAWSGARSCESPPADPNAGAADAARLLVEAAGHRVIDGAIRSVGCGGLMRRHPLSRRVTDLLVYLRQPAPDAAALRLARALGEGRHRPGFDHSEHAERPCRAD